MIGIPAEIYNIEFAIKKFNKSDLYNSGLKLFQSMGYPIIPLKTVINQEINDFIYLTINKKILFSEDELCFLNKINTISILFSLNTDTLTFHKIKKDYFNKVIFITVDLNSSKRDRSLHAHTITKILNKIISSPIFVLFYHENNMLFSGVDYENFFRNQSGEVFLSDWYSLYEIDNQSLIKLSSMSFWNHNQNILKELYYDLLYSISREYYIYPESNEYITYGFLSTELKNILIENENTRTFLSIKDFAEENSKFYQNRYKDDYVDNNEKIELLIADDDILLIDLDEYYFNKDESTMTEIDEYEEFIVGDGEEEGDSAYEELDDNIYEDPLKMLAWLEKDN